MTTDHFTYFAKQRAAMGSPEALLGPMSQVELKRCSAGNLSGSDDVYLTRCPYPWIEVAAAPTAATARILFPKDYFDWCKQYVTTAIRNQPSTTASAKARVLWALDLMTHVCEALISLNIPVAPSVRSGRSSATASFSGEQMLAPFTSAIAGFARNVELARSNVYLQYRDNPRFKEEVQRATTMPAPFAMLPLQWIGRGIMSKDTDPIYERIYRGLVPMAGEGHYALQSVGGKDGVELLNAIRSADAPMIQGILQWRLWCVRDGIGVPAGMDVHKNPLGWGPSNNQKTLAQVIDHATRSEKQTPELVYGVVNSVGRLYPNFAYAFNGIEHIAQQLTAMGYEATIKRHVTAWIGDALPRADEAGRPAKDARGYDVPQPVSYTDHKLIREGNAAAATAAARSAAANPKCEGSNQRLCQQSLRIRQLVMNSPLVPVYKAMMAIGDKLTQLIGGAVGVGSAVYPVEQPFVRSFSDGSCSTVPNGSSTVLVPRILASIGVLEELTGLDLCAQCPEVPREAGAAPGMPAVPAPAPAPPPPGPTHLCAPAVTMYEATHKMQFTAQERAEVEALCRTEYSPGGRQGVTRERMDQIRLLHAARAVTLTAPPSKLAIVVAVAATAAAGVALGPVAAAGAAVVGAAAIVLRKKK